MAQFSELKITENGQTMIAQIMAGEIDAGTVKFTRVVTSNHDYSPSELETLTEIADIQQEISDPETVRVNDDTVRIETNFPNTELDNGYSLRTLGIFAQGGEAEILFAAAREESGNCYMPAHDEKTVSSVQAQFLLTVGNADAVSFVVDPAGAATLGDVQELRKNLADHNASANAHAGIRDDVKNIQDAFQSFKESTGSTLASQSQALATQAETIEGLSDNLNNHVKDTTVHITDEERTGWNAKASTQDITDAIKAHNTDPEAHNDIRIELDNIRKVAEGAMQAIQDYAYVITTVPVQNGTLTYNGELQHPSWIGYNQNALTLDGTTESTDAGTFEVTFTPKGLYHWENAEDDNDQSPKTVTWTINNQPVTVVPTPTAVLTYSGDEQSPEWKDYDTTKLDIGGDTAGTDAKTYSATFKPKKNYCWSGGETSAKTVTWTIDRAVIDALPTQSGTLTYSGTEQAPVWTGFDDKKMTKKETAQINAGTYSTTFTPTNNYKWSDGTKTGKDVAWTIGRATIAATPSPSAALTYTGQPQTPTWKDYDPAQLTKDEAAQTDAGTYQTTFTPTDNYQWSGADGTAAKKVSWTIGKATATVPTPKARLTYTGAMLSPTWDASYDTAKMTLGGATSGTNAGEYAATFTLTKNYQWSATDTAVKTVKWYIDRATIPKVPTQAGSLTYNTKAQTPTWNDYNASMMSMSQTAQTNAGTYQTTFTPTDNYQWSDGATTAKTANWTIAKAAGTLNITPTTLSLNILTKTGIITATRSGTGTISAQSSNTAAATVAVSGTIVTVTAVGNGSANITVKAAGDNNYNASSDKVCQVTVSMADTTLANNSWAQIDAISRAGLAKNYWKVGDTKDITISNYTQTVVIVDFDHDELSTGGKAGITFGLKNIRNTTEYKMNSSATNKGSFIDSELYVTLQTQIKNSLPADLQAVLKTVNKKTSAGEQSSTVNTNSMQLFLFSEVEVIGYHSNSVTGEGTQYLYFQNSSNRIQNVYGAFTQTWSATYWWLRSPYAHDNVKFCSINPNGGSGRGDSTMKTSLCYGFCV